MTSMHSLVMDTLRIHRLCFFTSHTTEFPQPSPRQVVANYFSFLQGPLKTNLVMPKSGLNLVMPKNGL